jgi:hypothetical protein
MVVFGDGGGFVRLYELRVNPLVSEEYPDVDLMHCFVIWTRNDST